MRYRQGVEAYDAGKYRVSVDYFLEADHLAPNAALSFNIARAYEKLNDPAATLRWYRDYTSRDQNNCDSCGHKCNGDTCVGGVCVPRSIP